MTAYADKPDRSEHERTGGFVLIASMVVLMWLAEKNDVVAGGLVVLAIYGWTLLIGLVPTPGVSWQGHLFGAVGGVVAARALHRTRPARRPGVAFSG